MVAIMQANARILSSAFLCIVFSLTQALLAGDPQNHATGIAERRLLGLIEYLAGDYSGAVEDGKVINATEYDEMTEFAHTAAESFKNLKNKLASERQDQISQKLQDLKDCIAEKCAQEKLLGLTHFLRDEFIEGFGISPAPSQKPSFAMGQEVFAQNCVSCHGAQGRGDGPLSPTLNPPPRSFHDIEVMRHASPFKVFNTLNTGITGTQMLSFETILTPEQMWSVSFYVMGLRFQDDKENVVSAEQASKRWTQWASQNPSMLPPDLAFLARHSDEELVTWMTENNVQDAQNQHKPGPYFGLGFLRVLAPFAPELALKPGQGPSADSSWDFIRKHIQIAKDQFAAQAYDDATNTLLDAYLEGFEGVEAPLAVIDHALLLTIERTFSIARTYAAKGQRKEFDETIADLLGLLSQAQTRLDEHAHESTGWHSGDFFSALVIILREGFEAFLIIVALLMIVKTMNVPRARIWIHGGWMLALLFGVSAYVLFERVLKISGATRETIEAFCTLAATVVLFYTGFWLLSQAEMSRWQKYIKVKTGQAIDTQRLWILAGISFIAVFRESAETVLFYSALLANAKSSSLVLAGFLAGLLMLFTICFAILKFNVRIPMKQFFFSTSLFMVLLSVVLAGKSVHELIAAGYIKATPMNSLPFVDVLGFYPLQETFLAQCLVLALAAVLLLKKNFIEPRVVRNKSVET